MAEFPALQLWTDAYLGDTTHLTTIEHGTYLLLLMTAWRTSDCSLPDNDKVLARYARLTASQWVRIKPVIADFWRIENGRWTQRRLTDEYNAVRQKREAAASNGRLSALKRKGRHATERQQSANEASTTTATATATAIKIEDDDVSACGREADFDLLELTNECAKAGGVRHLEPAAIARHVDQVREWQSAGVLPAEMLAWIRDVTSRHTEPIRSLKFFDAHIRQAIARKDNPHGNQSTVVGFGAARIRAGQGNPRAVAARELVAEAVEREQREAALLGEGGGNNWGIGAALPAEWR